MEGELGLAVDEAGLDRLSAAMPGLKPRADRLDELAENAAFYVRTPPLPTTAKARKQLTPEALGRLSRLETTLAAQEDWSEAGLEASLRAFAEAEAVKLGQVAQPLRAVLTGATASPGLFEVMAVLGRQACLERLATPAAGSD